MKELASVLSAVGEIPRVNAGPEIRRHDRFLGGLEGEAFRSDARRCLAQVGHTPGSSNTGHFCGDKILRSGL